MLMRLLGASILQERNRIYCILALISLLSTGFGVIYAATAEQTYFHLMRMAASRPVSIVGSMVAVFLPYIVSVLVVTNSKPWLSYTVVAVRLFLFAASGYAIYDCYGTAAWLIGFMFLFPDICLIPVLLWLTIRNSEKAICRKHSLLCLVYVAFVGIINFCTVSPFLADLLNTYESMGR